MQSSLVLAAIIGPLYLVLGLSILLYAKQWKKIVSEFSKNHFVMIANMFLALIFGLIIINMHNIWEWNLFIVITLTGWGALLKGVFYFLAPSDWIKGVLSSKICQSEGFLYSWGALLAILGALLSYNVYI